MNRRAALILSTILLAACSKEPDVDVRNASVDEVVNDVAEAGGSDILLRPGKWQTKVTVEDIAMPGMPAEAQAQMKRMFAQQQNVTVDSCVSPEDARRPDGKLFTGKGSDKCRYDRFTMTGGKVDAVMRCDGDGTSSMAMTMSGNYTPDSASTRSEMKITAEGQGGMTIKAVSEARRIGECDGKEG